MDLRITKALVMIMKYGSDIVILRTNYPEPLSAVSDPDDRLDLQFRAPRMQGETYVRNTFPGIPVEVATYTEGRVGLFGKEKDNANES